MRKWSEAREETPWLEDDDSALHGNKFSLCSAGADTEKLPWKRAEIKLMEKKPGVLAF